MFSSPYGYLVEGSPLQPGKYLKLYLSLAVRELLPTLLSSMTPEEGGWEESAWLGLELLGTVTQLQVGVSFCT